MPVSANAMMARRAWAANNRPAITAFVNAYRAAVAWMYDPANRTEAIAILARNAALDPALVGDERLEAEAVPKTDKLLRLLLDTGVDKRTVVSGIAAYYKPQDIIGHKVCLLINLAPRKIKGIESQGMILMAENAKGELSFVSPLKNEIENGSVIK